MTIKKTLKERGDKYGKFSDNAWATREMEKCLNALPGWERSNHSQKEAAHMIVHKLARAFSGDPDYDDNWVDIAGYSTLIVEQLRGADR